MPLQRISHSKSRYGCAQCKSRRLKCDETRPRCQRCQRSDQTCSFSQQSARWDLAANDEIPNIDDMFLLHHFFTASRDFSVDDTRQEPSADDPVALGFTHHYLLHSILALSALHLHSTDLLEHRHYDLAISHHDAAIRQARPHLLYVEKHHAEALFWFSVFTSLFAFAEPLIRPTSNKPTVDLIEELLKAFRLGRGVRTIMAQLDSSSPLSQIPTSGYFNDNREELEADLDRNFPQLGQLRNFIRGMENHGLTSEEATECVQVAEKLFLYIAVLQHDLSNKKTTYLIMVWSIDLSETFLQLCHSKHPVALTILAVYAVAFYTRQWFWPFRGWPVVLLKSCEDALEAAHVRCDSPMDFARMHILENR